MLGKMGVGVAEDVHFGAARIEKPKLFAKIRAEIMRMAPVISLPEADPSAPQKGFTTASAATIARLTTITGAANRR
jgi:hypothetical protein